MKKHINKENSAFFGVSLILFFTCYAGTSFADLPANTPKLKPGLWETALTIDNKAMPKMSQCVDDKTQAESEKMANDYTKKSCTNEKYRQSGNVFFAEMTCKTEGKTTKIQSETTMVSANEIKTKVVSVTDGKTEAMTSNIKRLGDCTEEKSSNPSSSVPTKMDKEALKELLKQMKK